MKFGFALADESQRPAPQARAMGLGLGGEPLRTKAMRLYLEEACKRYVRGDRR